MVTRDDYRQSAQSGFKTMQSDQSQWFYDQLKPHEPMLRAWLHRRFRSIDRLDTDDIVQEAYIRVLTAREERGELERPKAFLFMIVRNLALDLLRHRKVAKEYPLVESGGLNVLDEGDSIPDVVARRQEIEFLVAAIQSLPGRCREVCTLRKVYGLSPKDIAARLCISEHTVSAQLTIGVHKITEYFNRHHRELTKQ